jgi:hypothetical protein
MKPLIALLSSFFLCSCADMYVSKTDVAGGSSHTVASSDAKDFDSKNGIRMLTSCGIGAHPPKAIYIRPFCVDTAIFKGDQAASIGEMPIRKAIMPHEFAGDLKESLEKLAPTRILEDDETPRTGWLIEGEFMVIDGGDPTARFFFGTFGVGRSHLVMHVKVIDVDKGITAYEFDLAGGSFSQGRHGTIRASGLGRATTFDLVNAAERIYLVLNPNSFRYGARTSLALH